MEVPNPTHTDFISTRRGILWRMIPTEGDEDRWEEIIQFDELRFLQAGLAHLIQLQPWPPNVSLTVPLWSL